MLAASLRPHTAAREIGWWLRNQQLGVLFHNSWDISWDIHRNWDMIWDSNMNWDMIWASNMNWDMIWDSNMNWDMIQYGIAI